MGAEAFQVMLWSAVPMQNAEQVVGGRAGVHRHTVVNPMSDARYFLYEDSEHVVELLLRPDDEGSRISMRFALCHPDSIEETFARLVLDIATDLHADFAILDTVNDEEPEELDWTQGDTFRQALGPAIRFKRTYWQRAFGVDRARLTCSQAVMELMVNRGPAPRR